ncbi:MAG: GTPase HflX [Armatimonadota bacterium]
MINIQKERKERAILVAVELPSNRDQIYDLTAELELLAYSAGAQVTEVVMQKRESPDPAYFIGKGKIEQLKQLVYEYDVNLIIFLNDLKPIQERNISEALNKKVIDRHALILDIFAMRAKSREGKIQVELAQLNYLLPRLTGYGVILSRLGGGIGTRGPGETKLETDKRHINKKIATLRKELKKVEEHRELLRSGRHKRGFKIAAIVGYTNAGKSTLLNTLTGANSLVEDKLFATLDPMTKIVTLPQRHELLLVDTVGFIRNLPVELVAAFKSTLEEARYADMIINVMDISDSHWYKHYQVVNEILADLAADNKPVLNVLNKVDLVEDKMKVRAIRKMIPESVVVSASSKIGFKRLLNHIEALIMDDISGNGW